MADESTYVSNIQDAGDELAEQSVDISKILSDVKEFTAGSENANKEQKAQEDHLIEVLIKIGDLTDGNLKKDDINKIFKAFGENFKNKLESNLTSEQAQNLKNEIEYLINNTTFDDKELELQMNNLYTLLHTFLEPEQGNEEKEDVSIAADLVSDLKADENVKGNADGNIGLSTDSNDDGSKDIKEGTKNTQEEFVSDINDESKETDHQEEIIDNEDYKNFGGYGLDDTGSNTEESVQYGTEKLENETDFEIENEIEVEAEKQTKKKTKSTNKKDKDTQEIVEIDSSIYRENLDKYISDKEFPGKKVVQDMINENDEVKKQEKLKILQLQLIPYYDGKIDGLINAEILTAMEKYINKNLNQKGDNIVKANSSNIIRCGSDGKIIDTINGLNVVIKKIGDKKLGHAYFLDYPDFEYTIENNNTTITATVNDFNYFYDISKNTLQKQKGEDPLQDVTKEKLLQKYFQLIAISVIK